MGTESHGSFPTPDSRNVGFGMKAVPVRPRRDVRFRGAGKYLLVLSFSQFDPQQNSPPGSLFFGRLTGAISRGSVYVHGQGELKRGTVGYVCRGP
jgi:hypothetical protein